MNKYKMFVVFLITLATMSKTADAVDDLNSSRAQVYIVVLYRKKLVIFAILYIPTSAK